MSLPFSILKRDGKYWLEASYPFYQYTDDKTVMRHAFKREDGQRMLYVEVDREFMKYDR